MNAPAASQRTPPAGHGVLRVLLASLAGTTIEFFDFYIYATAAVLVFPKLFFPASDATAATLQSLATFALAFFARPIGSALFGHYGDRIGRKATLVAALLTMGTSTVVIGLLPTHASIGVAAPLLLAVCRLGQGLGLGGEWGGAVLLAIENAPPARRAWYGMFPQLGAPLGFVCSSGVFLLLTATLDDAQFLAYGWRIPFLASALLVALGLYVRLKLTETPAFLRALERDARVRIPLTTVLTRHAGTLLRGVVLALTTFLLFYLMTVFALSWGTSALGYPRREFLWLQLLSMAFFAAGIPLAARAADRYGARSVLIAATILIALFGLCFPRWFVAGQPSAAFGCLALGMFLMGLTYGPLGTALAQAFPTLVRYTGASLAFNLAGIFGASLAPYFATWLASRYTLAAVGIYLAAVAALTLMALLWSPRAERAQCTEIA
jgi:metabolite-proton symporter